jgi:DNA helicase II / ATP-dependent DNA helicase PcrA
MMSRKDAKRRAIEEYGTQLITAGPGSGKTCVIIEKISRLIEGGVQPENILALTFSRKAAAEMVERVEEKKIDPSGITISTFHSFCYSLLKENPFECGISPSSKVITRAHQLVWGIKNVDSFDFEHIKLGSNAANVIESIIDGISTFRDEFLVPKDLEDYLSAQEEEQLSQVLNIENRKYWDLLKVWKAYEAHKLQMQLIDHDDMHIEAVRLLKENPAVLERYRSQYTHFFVDEFQDTNYVQLCLIKLLAGDNLCVVGDNDQSIYQFRRAYPTNFQDYQAHFAPSEILLEEDHRNSDNILQCALQLMRKVPNRAEKPLWTKNENGDLVAVGRCENEDAEAAYVVEEIQKLIGTERISRQNGQPKHTSYKDIAVLSRRRVQGAKVYSLLRQRGMPAEFVGEVNFFESPTIRDAIAYLEFASEPLLAAVPLFRIMKTLGIHETNIKRINAYAREHKAVSEIDDGVYESMRLAQIFLTSQGLQVEEIAHLLGRLLNLKRRVSLLEFVDQMMKRYSSLYQQNIGAENLENIRLLNKFLGLVEEYAATVESTSIADLLEYIQLVDQFDVDSDEPEERDSVKIMTAHQSKGKQFHAVFILDLAKNRFPSSYREKKFRVPRDLARSLQPEDDPEELFMQEERRLLYVAMTRAEHNLYLTCARRYGTNKEDTDPSQFLMDLNFEFNPLMQIVDIPAGEVEELATHPSPLEHEKRNIQNQVSTAAFQMRLKSAFQGLLDLERIRLVESGKGLEEFKVDVFVEDAYRADGWLRKILSGTPLRLVGDDQHFSPSALDKYNTCPLRYKFEYVLKIPPAKQGFILGAVVHDVIHYLALEELRGMPPTEWRALEVLEKLWPPRAFISKTEEAEQKEEAQKALEKYVAWNETNENELIGTEVEFFFSLDGWPIKGRIDRLERTSDGEYVLSDFKTTKEGESRNSITHSIQINTYCLAVMHKYGKLPERASLVYLKGRKRPVHYYPDPLQIRNQETRLKGLIANIMDEQFNPAIPSLLGICRWCGFKTECTALSNPI